MSGCLSQDSANGISSSLSGCFRYPRASRSRNWRTITSSFSLPLHAVSYSSDSALDFEILARSNDQSIRLRWSRNIVMSRITIDCLLCTVPSVCHFPFLLLQPSLSKVQGRYLPCGPLRFFPLCLRLLPAHGTGTFCRVTCRNKTSWSSDLSMTSNMMQDTKHFQPVCHGRVGVETPWANAWGSRWEFFNYRGTAIDAAPSTVEVVDMTSQASADRAGLWPLGARSASEGGLLRDDFCGSDVRALLLTVLILPAAAQGACRIIQQGCDEYTSSYVGSFTAEVGVFVNVLEHTGSIRMYFASNFGAGVTITGPASQGWQYLHNSKAAWCAWQESEILGERSHARGHSSFVPVIRQPLQRASVVGVRP